MFAVGRNLLNILSKRFGEQWMTKPRNYANKLRHKSSLANSTTTLLDFDPEPPIESCYFKNGMRLVCECKDTFTTSIGCFLPGGAIHENSEEHGCSLFLEHLLFRNTNRRTQHQLEQEVEEAGGSIDTIAMRDMLVFYGTLSSDCADILIELFADVILNGIIYEEDVTAEKSVILRQMNKIESDMESTIMDYLPSVAYQGTPLAKSIYPKTSLIKTFSTECLTKFRSRVMKPCLITIISTGSVSFCDLQKMICRYFCTEECETMPRCEEEVSGYRFSGVDFRLRHDSEKLGYIAIGVEGPNYSRRQDHIAFTVAQAFVGSWDMTFGGSNHNAPFIAHCAFNNDLCHLYKSFYLNWKKASIWGCYYVADKMRLEDMLSLVQGEWLKLCTSITDQQVQRAVNQCKIHELLKLHNPVERLLDLIDNFSRRGNYQPTRERLERYETITAATMREVAEKYIYNQSPVVVAVGRIENLPDYCNIENGMYSLRY